MNKIRRKQSTAVITIIAMLFSLLTVFPLTSTPVYAAEPITDLYVTFDEANFTEYHIDQSEQTASEQFNKLVKVRHEDQDKYTVRCDLAYFDGSEWLGFGDNCGLISYDRDYYFRYFISAENGNTFSVDPDAMKFHVNGEEVTPYYKLNPSNTMWHIYVHANPPDPRPETVFISNAYITGVRMPLHDEHPTNSTPDTFLMFDVAGFSWSSEDDEFFENDHTFKQQKTYTLAATLTPKEGFAFRSKDGDPTVLKGRAKVNHDTATASIDAATGNLTVSYSFRKVPLSVTDVYLIRNPDNFIPFQVGKPEGLISDLFSYNIEVRPEDQNKYCVGQCSSLVYKEGETFHDIGDGSHPISSDKDYYFLYEIRSDSYKGYAFSMNPNVMNFYIDGEKVNPVKSESYFDYDEICWKIYMPAGKPAEPWGKIRAKLYGHDDIHVSWAKYLIGEGSTGYKVEYKRSTWSDYRVLYEYRSNNYFKKADLVDGAKYRFRITPLLRLKGAGENGEDVIIDLADPIYTPYIYTLKKIAAPRVSKSSRNYVRLRWTNIPGESGYQIARSRYKTKNFSTVKRVSYKYSTTTAKTIRNRTYYYKIRAYKTVDGKRIYAPWSNLRAYKLR